MWKLGNEQGERQRRREREFMDGGLGSACVYDI